MVSPTNGGKKPGKFTRMMAWVDRKLCGGGSGAAAQPESQKPEQFKRTLTPEQLAERKEQDAKAAMARESDLSSSVISLVKATKDKSPRRPSIPVNK